MTRNIAIVGSRTITDKDFVFKHLSEMVPVDSIVTSGGAKGVDSLGEEFCKLHNIKFVKHEPDWEKDGNGAGFKRNWTIIKESDLIIAFWDGESKGTLDTIQKGVKSGKQVVIFNKAGSCSQQETPFDEEPNGEYPNDGAVQDIETQKIKLKEAHVKQDGGLVVAWYESNPKVINDTITPKWDMVTDLKKNVITEDEYATLYKKILHKVDDWDPIIKEIQKASVDNEVFIKCYCLKNRFCHRTLLINYLKQKYPNLFE